MVTPARGIRKGRKRNLLLKDEQGNPVRPPKVSSQKNGKPHKAFITYGGRSDTILHSPIDKRSVIGKQYVAKLEAMRAHLGGDLTEPQAELVDQAARLSVLSNISWAEIVSSAGLTKDDKTIPIIDVFLRTAKQQRDVLALLGIERRVKAVKLSDYLETKVSSEPA